MRNFFIPGGRLLIYSLLPIFLLLASTLRGDRPENTEAQLLFYKSSAWKLKSSHPDSAFIYAQKGLQLAREENQAHSQSTLLYILSALHFEAEDYAQALHFATENLTLCRQHQYYPQMGNALDILGTIYVNLGDHRAALDFYLQELELLENHADLSHNIGSVCINIASLYEKLGLLARSKGYLKRAKAFFQAQAEPDSSQLAILALNQSNLALHSDSLDQAEAFLLQAIPYFAQQQNLELLAKCANNTGLIALERNQFSVALVAFQEALAQVSEMEVPQQEDQIRYLINLSSVFEKLNQPEASYKMAREAFQRSRNLQNSASLQLVHERLKDYFLTHNLADSALVHFQLADSIREILLDQEREKMMVMADFEFEVSQHKQKLLQAQGALAASETLKGYLTLGLGILVLGLFLFGWSYYQFRQKKQTQIELMAERGKNQEQLLQGLLQGQELKSIGYIIEGQEQEKRRISEELHDGLGGTLAAVRISLDQFRRQLAGQPEVKLADFDYALNLLREATEDVRRISHDMGAVRLKHGGLVPALKDMCQNLSRHQRFVAKLETEGLETLRINGEVEFHLYRIAQELFQNVIKHAQANQIKLQLTHAGGRLHLYMWDDGRGFDPELVRQGMGMENLRLRTQQLNGKIHVDSAPGKGTYTHISIPV